MLKGTARRIIVVKSPDPRIFEEAIFIMRDDFPAGGTDPEQAVKEARRVADSFVRGGTGRSLRRTFRLPAPLYAAAGAAAAGAAWLAMRLAGAIL